MRDIKFRGFTINEEKYGNGKDGWIYGNLLLLDNKKAQIQDINDDNFFKFIDIKSLGQYTGSKDKNGKEIYEGDIIFIKGETKLLDIKGKVEYSNILAQFIITNTGNIVNEAESLGDYEEEDIEKIGNVYDNPELLEKGE